MNPQRDKKKIINYPPETLRTFEVLMYEWIDNLNFTLDPTDCVENPNDYVSIVKDIFLEAGWDGDGAIELMWIPPFMFDPLKLDGSTLGVVVWHVKQREDGLSWVLHPRGMFERVV